MAEQARWAPGDYPGRTWGAPAPKLPGSQWTDCLGADQPEVKAIAGTLFYLEWRRRRRARRQARRTVTRARNQANVDKVRRDSERAWSLTSAGDYDDHDGPHDHHCHDHDDYDHDDFDHDDFEDDD